MTTFYKNWWEEKRSAYLYQIMADSELNVLHKQLFLDLKKAADKQANIWVEEMKKAGEATPVFKPNMRTRLVAFLIQKLGSENIHHILSAMKIRGMSVFTHYHAEHRHTSLNASSNLRAAVFGINDGLVSNMSLILGVAGANANNQFIILAGIAGLLAGAFSMGAGEYVSVRSQREIFEYQIAIERQELEEYPEEEMEELSLIYQARGVPKAQADKLAEIFIENPETGLNALAREELGLNPEELVSPIGAMLASFFAFSIGALIPLLPFFFHPFGWQLQISMAFTGITLFLTGAVLSLFTNRSPLISGLRMMLIGAIAGTVTYLIGKFLGVSML